MTTTVALTDSPNYTMSFDIKPRDGGDDRGNKDTSDMKVSLGGKTVYIESDEDGNLSISSDDATVGFSTSEEDNGWTKVTVEFTDMQEDTAELEINGTGAEDTYGMLLDNIRLVESSDVVEDVEVIDTPSSENEAVALECVEGTTNLTFVVDVSSSMSDEDLVLTENSIQSLWCR